MENKCKIGFIGAGNMGSAIMKGIAEFDVEKNIDIYAYDLNKSQLDSLEKYGVKALENEVTVINTCKYVVLAIKPQMFEDVLKTFGDDVNEDTVFVSIAAGISSEYIQKMTLANAKVILVMPNTPLLIGEGASALSRNDRVSDEEFNVVLNIFKACGKAEVISQNKMKEIIAINGSSPAFIYLFAKGFIEYAEQNGIDTSVASELFTQTLVGSAKMISESGYTIDELIKMVSSPGGTTLAGLDAFYEGDLVQVVKNACDKCTKRAYELSK